VMDGNIKDKILNRPRSDDWRKWSPPDLSLREVRHKFGAPNISDEELVLRVIAGEAAVKTMLAAGAPKQYLSAAQPLIKLIDELAKRRDCSQVYIQKGDLTLRLERTTNRLLGEAAP
jgi:oxaloacetate decarboxylase alpha subunit